MLIVHVHNIYYIYNCSCYDDICKSVYILLIHICNSIVYIIDPKILKEVCNSIYIHIYKFIYMFIYIYTYICTYMFICKACGTSVQTYGINISWMKLRCVCFYKDPEILRPIKKNEFIQCGGKEYTPQNNIALGPGTRLLHFAK